MNLAIGIAATVGLLLSAAPSALLADEAPDGSDVDKAIPIYFNQTVNGTIDVSTKPWLVYSITLAEGQQFSATATTKTAYPNYEICLFPSTVKTISNTSNCATRATPLASDSGYQKAGLSFDYQVSKAGTYFLMVQTGVPDLNYALHVTASGTPIVSPRLPAQAVLRAVSITSLTPCNLSPPVFPMKSASAGRRCALRVRCMRRCIRKSSGGLKTRSSGT